MGTEGIWETAVSFAQFCCEPKTLLKIYRVYLKSTQQDFPGGTVVKNPPANAGDTGLSPGPGRSHMQQSN